MTRPEDDRQREREEYQENHQHDGDAEAAPRLRSVHRRQGRGRGLLLTPAVASQDVRLVEPERPRVGSEKAAYEDLGRELRVLVVFEVAQDTHGDAGGLGQLGDRHLPPFPLALQVASQ